jgi:hypothetical protein
VQRVSKRSGRRVIRGRGVTRIGLVIASVGLAIGCAIPGRNYLVVPAINGDVLGASTEDDIRLSLRVMHRESPTLHQEQELTLPSTGRFSFRAVDLEIAGHEFSKHYLVYLHLRTPDRDRVIWRADLSRRALAGPIDLDCDLDRPVRLGQPCQVHEPTRHPWLIEEGEHSFQKMCARCHQGDGSGSEEPLASGRLRAPDLRKIAARRGGRFDPIEIAEWIEGRSLPTEHGTRQMPIWGEKLSAEYARYAEGDELVGARLDPLIAYLESLQEGTQVRVGSR